MADGPRAPGDDVLVGRRVVRGEDHVHLRFHALDRERPAVEDQLVAANLGAAKQLAARVHRRVRGTLRSGHPCELGLGLGVSPILEQLLVDGELDAVGAEAVGEPDGESAGTLARLSPRLADGPHRKLRVELPVVDPDATSSS